MKQRTRYGSAGVQATLANKAKEYVRVVVAMGRQTLSVDLTRPTQDKGAKESVFFCADASCVQTGV